MTSTKLAARGYYFDKQRGTYRVAVYVNGKKRYVGAFPTETEARQAYVEAKRGPKNEFAGNGRVDTIFLDDTPRVPYTPVPDLFEKMDKLWQTFKGGK